MGLDGGAGLDVQRLRVATPTLRVEATLALPPSMPSLTHPVPTLNHLVPMGPPFPLPLCPLPTTPPPRAHTNPGVRPLLTLE